MEKGSLSISSENMFPIIKKWLYSDHDIFIRELISNGCDAITKLKKLSLMGEYEIPDGEEFAIYVKADPEAKTLTFADNGVGMTEEEVKSYINQIAFSGAAEFLEKYKDKANADQIIGHFGLGFYSAFMVADKVTIDTLSYKKGAKPVHWESEAGVDFEMGEGDYAFRGTSITLYLSDDSYEFSNEYRLKEVLDKYCSFMPEPIYLGDPRFKAVESEEENDFEDFLAKKYEEKKAASEGVIDVDVDENGLAKEAKVNKFAEAFSAGTEEIKAEEAVKEAEKEEKKAEEAADEEELPKLEAVNDIHPLWAKHPNECTEDEYKNFYRKVFHDYKEPLFWIHLNMDYPFNLKGILYFPQINTEYDRIEGTIKLYNNQVFIADNIKEVIPEFLMLLKGCIDCPDLPLNVSRSALQNDGFVKKISDYITKKVADKLSGMFKYERESYEKYWDDISPFIKFGYLKDEKFQDKIEDYIIFKDLNDKYITLDDYVKEAKGAEEPKAEEKAEEAKTEEAAEEKTEETSEEKTEEAAEEKKEDAAEEKAETKKTKIFYVTDVEQQGQYIKMFKDQGLNALLLTHSIDSPFITQLEIENDTIKFERIDADLADEFKEDADLTEEEINSVVEVFKRALGEKLEIKVEKLKNEEISGVVVLSEEGRRMQEMMKMYGMSGKDLANYAANETLVLNANNDLVQSIIAHPKAKNTAMYCEQVYDLARLAQRPLAPDEMAKFVDRSNKIMMLLSGKK